MQIGTHRARAVDVALGYTSNGNPQIAVAFQVTEGDCTGETITWYGFFSEKTQKRTIESLRHAGWAGDDLGDLTADDLGTEVDIVVNEEEDLQGRPRMKVSWVNRLGAGAAIKERMDDASKRAFAAKMKGLCMTVSRNGAGSASDGAKSASASGGVLPAKPSAARQQANVSDDDIPF